MRSSHLAFLALLTACSLPEGDPGAGIGEADLPLGEVNPDDMKDDGVWGYATICKPVPNLPALVAPRITVSIDGLTLRLVDDVTGYDKVFPVGVGQMDPKSTSLTFGESLSMYPPLAYRKNDFVVKPVNITPCKIWWKDPDSGQNLPVFAGLPFISWSGSYGIHGPIDGYRAINGGSLRPGYVSHGCVRMESADVLEVYARIKGVASVPVHVQREPERLDDGDKVQILAKWVGSECDGDSDCNYTGGVCKQNPWSGRGFCSAACTRSCTDKPGYPMTYCVADPDEPSLGMCVNKVSAQNAECRPYDHFVAETQVRFNDPGKSATVCMPGSPGWVGDRCFTNGDCDDGTHCAGATDTQAGFCTMSCARYCSDQNGYADTFCVDGFEANTGSCVRTCTPASNGAECPEDFKCEERTRRGDTTRKYVCVPE
jgi:hypothetical protein